MNLGSINLSSLVRWLHFTFGFQVLLSFLSLSVSSVMGQGQNSPRPHAEWEQETPIGWVLLPNVLLHVVLIYVQGLLLMQLFWAGSTLFLSFHSLWAWVYGPFVCAPLPHINDWFITYNLVSTNNVFPIKK